MHAKLGEKPTHTNPAITISSTVLSLLLMLGGIALVGAAFKTGHPTNFAVGEFWAGIFVFSLACYWALEVTPWLEKRLGR